MEKSGTGTDFAPGLMTNGKSNKAKSEPVPIFPAFKTFHIQCLLKFVPLVAVPIFFLLNNFYGAKRATKISYHPSPTRTVSFGSPFPNVAEP